MPSSFTKEGIEMKLGFVLAVLSAILISCNPQIPQLARLEVYVYWDNQPQANKRVELIELKQEKLTNTAGLTDFNLLQGNYTLRVYDINRGGPLQEFFEQPITTKAGETTRIEVLDCIPCV
jgi:hypothetical protein